ncbi:polycomb group RING finger protein 1-like [Corticium candelabrum]|uniref:polycomb group RING finger protein 1-like n=1 Tax=Corticium candelabrum TaxID=121492 RepID=UPI002E2600B5|nr:polycomb group RING finger protein 1-like [Corticium candelabrum]XP_062519060.1 polycomb group RING finger protein 1-like [Corticium candelabrum]
MDDFCCRFSMPVKVSVLNEHLVCRLCWGYIIEATVVVECLHAFCRSCIVKHVTRPDTRHRCPVCNVLIRDAQPLAGLRLDRTLQDIIDKLLPQVKEENEKNEDEFNASRNIEKKSSPSGSRLSSSSNSPVERTIFATDEEKISFLLQPSRGESFDSFKKYLRCSSRMTVLHLKRFLLEKVGWSDAHQLQILCRGNVLRDELTLAFIWRIRWGNMKSLLIIEYTFTKNSDAAAAETKTETWQKGKKRMPPLERTASKRKREKELSEEPQLVFTIVDSSSSASESSEPVDDLADQDDPPINN